jgi:hypothetical protein
MITRNTQHTRKKEKMQGQIYFIIVKCQREVSSIRGMKPQGSNPLPTYENPLNIIPLR